MINFRQSKTAVALMLAVTGVSISVLGLAGVQAKGAELQISGAELSGIPEISVTKMEGGSGPAICLHSEEIRTLKQKNLDVQGWIDVPGLDISYPVVRDVNGNTNLKYLSRDVMGRIVPTRSNSSAIFMDYDASDLTKSDSARNTVIYGHNWTNIQYGSTEPKVGRSEDKMFARLPSLANINVACGVPFFTLESSDESNVYLIFSAGYAHSYEQSGNPQGFYYLNSRPQDSEFEWLLRDLKDLSVNEYKVPVGKDDKIVILSTCSYKYFQDNNGRFIVAGRLLRKNETAYLYDMPTSK